LSEGRETRDSCQSRPVPDAKADTTTELPQAAEFVGSLPEDYDSYLGPFLFDHYAADLAARLDVQPGGRILDTACGTGIATEHLRGAAAADVEIVATDLSEAMLACARVGGWGSASGAISRRIPGSPW